MNAGGFSLRWWLTTFLVLVACAVMVRLGLWQLDRHRQRQAFNSRVESQEILPPLDMNQPVPDNTLPDMEYRSVVVVGEYDFSEQVALRNQVWENLPGVRLVTPLKIAGSDRSVIVERGWIPLAETSPENWSKYDEPGEVTVEGIIRQSTTRPEIGRKNDPTPAPGEGDLKEWNLLNVERIASQAPGHFYPIYIQQSAEADRLSPPYPSAEVPELSDGPHLGYAGQWFMFALLLGIGYPIYLRRQRTQKTEKTVDYYRRK
jgi:surfeit locus 1 family protein